MTTSQWESKYQYGWDSRLEQATRINTIIANGCLGRFQGSISKELESVICDYIGVSHAVALSSGTSALELLLRALDVGPGDSVIVPAFSWISNGSAVWACGAEVRVAVPSTFLVPSVSDIAHLVDRTTKAIVIAHMRGFAASNIVATSEQLGIPVIEDCCQAWGLNTSTGHVGKAGLAGFFSVQSNKLVAAGEGGFLVTNDQGLAQAIRILSGDVNVHAEHPTWRLNARMTELQAAVALPQFARLPALVQRLSAVQKAVAPLLRQTQGVLHVLPTSGDDTNGSVVGAFCGSRNLADALRERLRDRGVRASTPGLMENDLHVSASWPIGLPMRPEFATYVEVPMPDVVEADAISFITAVREAIELLEAVS